MKFEFNNDEFNKYFDRFDVNKDGVVTRDEFRNVVYDWIRLDFQSASDFNESLRREFRKFTEGSVHNRVNQK